MKKHTNEESYKRRTMQSKSRETKESCERKVMRAKIGKNEGAVK